MDGSGSLLLWKEKADQKLLEYGCSKEHVRRMLRALSVSRRERGGDERRIERKRDSRFIIELGLVNSNLCAQRKNARYGVKRTAELRDGS